MAWCPKCKRDYIDEVTECKECEIQLFDGESDNYDLLLKDSNEETVYTVYNYLNETTNYTTELFADDDNGIYEIYALREEIENIKKAIIMFLEDELKNSDEEALENLAENLEDEVNKKPASATYVSAKDKYEERQSSAFSTLFVGVLGMIFMILKFMGISFISLSGSSDILFNITMTAIFAIFIIVGIVTYNTAKALKNTITEEENIIEDLKKFFENEITAESIDNECSFTDETEELKYFARQSCIKEKINAKFNVSDENLIDQIIDEYYPLIFKDETNEKIEVLEINGEEV